jgi:hypothetical protein
MANPPLAFGKNDEKTRRQTVPYSRTSSIETLTPYPIRVVNRRADGLRFASGGQKADEKFEFEYYLINGQLRNPSLSG